MKNKLYRIVASEIKKNKSIDQEIIDFSKLYVENQIRNKESDVVGFISDQETMTHFISEIIFQYENFKSNKELNQFLKDNDDVVYFEDLLDRIKNK